MTAPITWGREAAISSVLERSVRSLEPQGLGRWTFRLGRRGAAGSARLARPWLTLEMPLPGRGADPAQIAELLERGEILRGGARIVLAEDGAILLRADVAVEPDVPIEDRVAGACRGLREASIVLRGRPLASSADRGGSGSGPLGDPIESIAAVCAESGWPCRRRSGGELAVDLDVADGFYQAIVRPASGGTALAFAGVAPPEALASPVSRAALAALLAAAAREVPLVRASIARTPGFAIAFGADPRPSEIDHAFASLSIACGICGREAGALVDGDLAARYLRIRGGAPEIARAASR